MKAERRLGGRKETSRKWGNMYGGAYGHDDLEEIIFMKLNPMNNESTFKLVYRAFGLPAGVNGSHGKRFTKGAT